VNTPEIKLKLPKRLAYY